MRHSVGDDTYELRMRDESAGTQKRMGLSKFVVRSLASGTSLFVDEIWFAAKDEGEASRLWSLADVHEPNGNLVSKNAAFGKQYLAGRYGAGPHLTRTEGWVLADK